MIIGQLILVACAIVTLTGFLLGEHPTEPHERKMWPFIIFSIGYISSLIAAMIIGQSI